MRLISSFNNAADDYDKWHHTNPGSLILESEVKAIKTLNLEGFGVEVGVGTGVFSSKLGVPLGIDPALKMINIAKKRGVEVVQAVGELLPIKSDCLDYVLIVFTFCFFEKPQKSLNEVWRVLKTGGNLIMGFISLDSEWGKTYLKKKSEGHRFYKYANFYSVKQIETMLESEGFKINKYSATLFYKPENTLEVEEPSINIRENGFICIKATKSYVESLPPI